MVYHYTKRATLARLLANKGPAIYVVHLNKYFVIPPRYYLVVTFCDREEEWEVEEILNSCWHQRRFQFLVKWKGFSRKHNSWEVTSDVKAPDLIAEYYQKHPATPRHIRQTDFDAIFNPGTIASRRSNLGEGVNIRGPLTHNPRAPSVASQHNFIMQPLVTKEWNARAF